MGGLAIAVVLAVAGATASGPSRPHARHHRLAARDLAFQPPHLAVAAGDTLSWVNHDIVPHTVTVADARWDSGELLPGDTFTVVLENVETLRYECRYHPTMTGTLAVR